MQISSLCRRSFDIAERMGWHGPHDTPSGRLLKIVADTTEVAEELRRRRDPKRGYIDENGKPCGAGTKLADIIIRVADLAFQLGVDLENEIGLKLAFNERYSGTNTARAQGVGLGK